MQDYVPSSQQGLLAIKSSFNLYLGKTRERYFEGTNASIKAQLSRATLWWKIKEFGNSGVFCEFKHKVKQQK